ncbi:MAG TPA: M56 family metallopeptidase [Patescibacteria group bacterium]|nr:M56 family metallopeptidase [Patescibacteria group bacterium]
MSVTAAWPLLAFVVVPGVFAWWSGHRLVRRQDDPALAERLLARAQHTWRVMLLSCVALVFAAGQYYWFAVLGLVVGLWLGDYPSRRVLLDERWGLGTYLLWLLRFSIAWLGFWFVLLLAPTVIAAADVWRWPVAWTLAVILGLWALRSTETFLWLVGARPRLWRTEWQRIIDRSRATRPLLFEMPVPGGRFVTAFAFPSANAPSVLFTESAVQLLSAREQAAVFAHEVAHLEHYGRRGSRIVWALTYGLVLTAPLGAALALDRLPGGRVIAAWSVVLVAGFVWNLSLRKTHETESDIRALDLCEDPEALVSGLTKMTIAGRMPRRWSVELEHGSSHPSLARRLHAIRRVAAILVMPFDDTLVVATTRPTALVILDHEGVSWVEARDPAERNPETLRATARSRWSVPYDELVEFRVRAAWWGDASLVARDRSGASRAVQIAPGEVERLQRKLDAIEPRLAHDTFVSEPPAVAGRFTAMALAVVTTFVDGLLALGLITGLVAIIRPSRAALAAVAGVSGACLLAFAADIGVRSPTWATLAYAAGAGLVCVVAVWLAVQPRTFAIRPADYLPILAVLAVAVALTWGPLLAHLMRTTRRGAVTVHLLGGAPVLWAALLALAAALSTVPRRVVRWSAAVVLAAAAVGGPGVKLVDTLVTSRPGAVGEMERGTLERTTQLELPWRSSTLRVSPAGARTAVMTRDAPRAPEHFLILAPEGGRADVEARDLRFVDDNNALILVESPTRTTLQHLELAESGATAGWSIALPPLSAAKVTSIERSGWAAVGYDGDAEEFVGLAGRIGSPGMTRYRWAVDNSESIDAEVVEILPDGRGFRAIRGVTTLAGLPWGGWIYDRRVRRQTRLWRVNGNVQELVAIWPTTADCRLVAHPDADVVCVGDRNDRTLIWRFGLDAAPARPLAVPGLSQRTGVSPDGRFVALWGKDSLVVVDLDRAAAMRRPLPAEAGVPSHLVPLADRLVGLFRRAHAAPVLEVFDTRW